MNAWLILIAVLAAAGSGVLGFNLGQDAETARSAREERLVQQATYAAATASAQAISAIRVTNTTIHQELQREIREKPVYLDCRHSPDGLRAVNAALVGARPESVGGGQLPTADSSGR